MSLNNVVQKAEAEFRIRCDRHNIPSWDEAPVQGHPYTIGLSVIGSVKDPDANGAIDWVIGNARNIAEKYKVDMDCLNFRPVVGTYTLVIYLGFKEKPKAEDKSA